MLNVEGIWQAIDSPLSKELHGSNHSHAFAKLLSAIRSKLRL